MLPLWLRKYIGLPFDKYDCWQLIRKIYREQLSVDLPDFKLQYRNPKNGKVIAKLTEYEAEHSWRPALQPQIFDCILIRILGLPWHIGLVVDSERNLMLHTLFGCDSVIEPYNNKLWEPRILAFYRYGK